MGVEESLGEAVPRADFIVEQDATGEGQSEYDGQQRCHGVTCAFHNIIILLSFHYHILIIAIITIIVVTACKNSIITLNKNK